MSQLHNDGRIISQKVPQLHLFVSKVSVRSYMMLNINPLFWLNCVKLTLTPSVLNVNICELHFSPTPGASSMIF